MSATATPTRSTAVAGGGTARAPEHRGRLVVPGIDRRLLWPTVATIVNAIAFFLLRPGVNDLWAARARAFAVEHGVGLTYWFGWFGGATPGNYSVLSPYVCAVIGTELVGALSAVALTPLVSVAVRGTARPVAASWVAALCVALNIWSGRVPFLFGDVFAVAALIAVQRRRPAAAVALTLLTVLISPVSGAFLVLGLTGTFLTTRLRGYRPAIAWAAGTVLVAGVAVAVVFGGPGSEPFPLALAAGSLGASLILLYAGPPDHLRATIWITTFATFAVFAVPNAMGANIGRFVWFCLPVAVTALGAQPMRWIAVTLIPAIGIGGGSTIIDLANATQPVSSLAYYRPLARHLDNIANLDDYRLEVVNHGAHAGYDTLLGHATLARGWETQEDHALNPALDTSPLSPITYKVWLADNAVGYVALPTGSISANVEGGDPEYRLVRAHRPAYLVPVWSDPNWRLYRVSRPTPIVGPPASIVRHDQSSMTVRVPCACTVELRLRWSKFLTARLQSPAAHHRGTVDHVPTVEARVLDDGYGWTRLRTARAGVYRLRGSFGSGLLPRLTH